MVTTKIVDRVNKVIALTDRVKKRREEYLSANPHLCAERSRLVTQSWKETEGEPLDIRRAKLFKKVMEGISVAIREGELIVGSQSRYIRGTGPCVDFFAGLSVELFQGSRVTLSGRVRAAEVSEEEKASLLEDARYWKGKSTAEAYAKILRDVLGDKVADIGEARVYIGKGERPTSHRTLDYGKVLNKGLTGIIAEAKEGLQKLSFSDLSLSDKDDIKKYYFLQAVIIACEGAINFAHRYAELARKMAGGENNAVRKKELEEIADICHWVPANPARSFYEALQCVRFIQLAANQEHAYAGDSMGRMDQYLYPFYKRDLEEGKLSRQEAAELLGCLWIKLVEMDHARTKVSQETGEMNQAEHVVIGGVTRDGRDASNELSYLLLEVARQLRTPQPAVYVRCHNGTPEELWMKAVEVNRDRGDGVPAFLNDAPVLLNFVGKGIPLQEARDWVAEGCVHPFVNHASTGDRPILFNHAKVFDLALNNGVDPRTGKQLGPATGDPRNFSSFEEFYDAFKKQVDFFADFFYKDHRLLLQIRNDYYSLPFNSALLDDCIKKGKCYTRGGIRYPQLYYGANDRGQQNVANSLAAIKRLVFEDKKITMERLLEALKANFEGNGNEDIRRMCLAAPKYGNDDDYADEIFNDFSLWSQRRLSQEKDAFGLNARVHRGGATQHIALGKTVGALPDGRKAWEPLADGILSAMRGSDRKGPTAVINSASKVNHYEVATCALFNMKFLPSLLKSREGLQKLISLIKTYFDRGGYHIQFNLMGQETLCEAKKHPDQYRDLLVRIAGYSAYFVDLSPKVQDEIIARTEHTI